MSDVTPMWPEGDSSLRAESDPLDNLLDEEADDDFGYVVTKERANGPDGHPVKLADWSAQDFANIYTRFRPHLERHARRFLSNQSQVDEVVQDAFLYLMVSLPELDSEIGVLRFLKWKTRLLCLDVIRASGKAYIANLDDVAEPIASNPEVSSYLEQQDDAAVLRLALSKLTPRHREVLLASIYEEKSATEIAAQVGLSENATRQLIFRARSAFKKALLGDGVNTQGMSAAAILSVAARKASMEAKKVGAQAMVLVLFMMLAVGAFVNFTGRGTQTQQLAESQAPTPAEQAQLSEKDVSVQISENSVDPVSSVSVAKAPKPFASPSMSATAEISGEAIRSASIAMEQTSSITESTVLAADKRQLLRVSGEALSANFEYSIETKAVSSLLLTFVVDNDTYRAFPWEYKTDVADQGHAVITGKLGYFVDSNSRFVRGNPIQGANFKLILSLDSSGQAWNADLKLVN